MTDLEHAVELLNARIDDIQEQLYKLANSPVFDQKTAEYDYRLDRIDARLRQVEADVESRNGARRRAPA